MSAIPSAANTSASPSFAQQMPTAPRSICSAATRGDLCVLACGRSRLPPAFAADCMRDRLRVSFDWSTRTAGVGSSVISIRHSSFVFAGLRRAVGVFGIPIPGLFFDDQLNRIALVLVEQIVD